MVLQAATVRAPDPREERRRKPWRVRTYGLDVGHGQAWVDHIIAHPAMAQWETEALAESWREVGHEEELAACGDVTADYRTS